MAFVQCNFFSYQLGMDTEISALLPEKRQQRSVDRSKDKYKVLYLLHGHSDDHTAYIRKSLIELLVRDKDLVVVMPNAHRGMYTDGKIGHRYFSYIVDELPVVASNFFHAGTGPEDSDAVRSLSGQWDYTYEEGPGCHDWDFWNAYLPRMLRHFGLLDQSELGWMTSARVAGDAKPAVPTTGV